MTASVLSSTFKYLVPVIVVSLALFIQWFQSPSLYSSSGNNFTPESLLLAWFYSLSGGFLPTSLGGTFQPCPVPEVPSHMVPVDIPMDATYLSLPGTNDKLPQTGLGMCCRATAYDDESVRRSVLWYLLLGGRHIDTAQMYGNHQAIGQAIQQAQDDYNIPRSEIFVTTKLSSRNYGYFNAFKSVPRILEELGLDYVDLLLMDGPSTSFGPLSFSTECSDHGFSPSQCRAATWKALGLARRNGLIRNIGVANFNVQQLQDLPTSKYPIAVHQMAFNPWIPDHLQETYDYCQENGIPVVARSSLAGSTLQHNEALSQGPLVELAGIYNRTEAQVLLRWSMQKGNAIIPGTGNPQHMVENLEVYDFALVDEDMDRIDALRMHSSAQQFLFAPVDMS